MSTVAVIVGTIFGLFGVVALLFAALWLFITLCGWHDGYGVDSEAPWWIAAAAALGVWLLYLAHLLGVGA